MHQKRRRSLWPNTIVVFVIPWNHLWFILKSFNQFDRKIWFIIPICQIKSLRYVLISSVLIPMLMPNNKNAYRNDGHLIQKVAHFHSFTSDHTHTTQKRIWKNEIWKTINDDHPQLKMLHCIVWMPSGHETVLWCAVTCERMVEEATK